MYFNSLPRPLAAALALPALVSTATVYQGFNSGASKMDSTPKAQSDFEAEFTAAVKLRDAPGNFSSVRLYTNVQAGTTADPISAFQAAINTQTKMLLGVWCSGTTSITNELTALSSAITQYGSTFADLVVGISVGSEDLYRASESGIANNAGVGQGPNTIVSFIKEVRTAIKGTILSEKPVGHVDTWSGWTNSSNSAVVDAVDFVGVDIYPFFENDMHNTIDNSTFIFEYLYTLTVKAAGDKPVWVTETGWPVSGSDFGLAVASVDNSKNYWYNVGCKLFGRVNTFYYDLEDANPASTDMFAITDNLSVTPKWNLTCPAGSGAPAPIDVGPAHSSAHVAKVTGYSLLLVALVSVFVW